MAMVALIFKLCRCLRPVDIGSATQTRREEPVQCRERLGGLLRYYHQEAA
jgi:hypothetical protein